MQNYFFFLLFKVCDLGTFFLLSSFAKTIPENNKKKNSGNNKAIGNLSLK